jgi:predicted Zn-dependent protease
MPVSGRLPERSKARKVKVRFPWPTPIACFRLRPGAWLLILVSLVLQASAGCEIEVPNQPGESEGPGHRAQQLGLRPERELELGQKAYHEVLQESRGRILPADDPQVRRVCFITKRVVQAAGIRPLQREINLQLSGYRFEWEANVIDDRKVNAFCLPGGKIAVYTGILPVAQNDD